MHIFFCKICKTKDFRKRFYSEIWESVIDLMCMISTIKGERHTKVRMSETCGYFQKNFTQIDNKYFQKLFTVAHVMELEHTIYFKILKFEQMQRYLSKLSLNLILLILKQVTN